MSKLRVISYSELDTANQCSLKHQLAYVERWTGQKDHMSALGKGTAWHQVMEAHYNVLMRLQRDDATRPPEYTLKQCRDAAEAELRQMPDELADLIEWMYNGYVTLYGHDPEWRILAVEHSAECRLPTLTGHPSSFVLKIKIDLVVRNIRNGKIYVVDHKSGKDLPGKKAFELDDQFGLYTWGMRQLGKKVFGQIHNAARTYRLQAEVKSPGSTPLDERFRRTPLVRSDKELDITAKEAYQRARARYQQQAEVDRAARGGLPVLSPRHTDPDRCFWRCDFREACMAGRKGLDVRRFLRDTGFEQNFERH